MRTLTCGPYTIELFVIESVCGIVYAVMDHQSAEEIWCLLKERGLALAAISGVDWNRELFPWSAPKAFRNGADFGGQASVLLNVLTHQIILLTQKHLRCVPKFRGIAGYSLAGLFALWAVYQTDLFDRAASISGSLWFDGFLDFMRTNTPKAKLVYLSLGDREKEVKNPRLAVVEDCTVQAVELLRTQGVSTVFEMNRGGHFRDIPTRITRGIQELKEKIC
jgi:predicted alpha/beta superfamily hydrolase